MPLHAYGQRILLTFRRVSDLGILDEVLAEDVYGPTISADKPSFLLDLGAHIGTFSTLFLSSHPFARAVCVEPNPSSYSLLVQNLSDNGFLARSVCINGAVIPSSEATAGGFVAMDFPINQADVFEQFKRSSTGQWLVPGFSLPTVVSLGPANIPIVMKVDIEGGELPIIDELIALARNENTAAILMEYHGSESAFQQLTEQIRAYGYRCHLDGIILRATREVGSISSLELTGP